MNKTTQYFPVTMDLSVAAAFLLEVVCLGFSYSLRQTSDFTIVSFWKEQ